MNAKKNAAANDVQQKKSRSQRSYFRFKSSSAVLPLLLAAASGCSCMSCSRNVCFSKFLAMLLLRILVAVVVAVVVVVPKKNDDDNIHSRTASGLVLRSPSPDNAVNNDATLSSYSFAN